MRKYLVAILLLTPLTLSAQIDELEQRRTLYTKTYANGSSKTLEVNAAPVHYRAPDGRYKNIDTHWRFKDSTSYEITSGFYAVTYNRDSHSNFPLEMKLPDGTSFRSKLVSWGYYDRSSRTYERLARAVNSDGEVRHNCLYFKNVFRGVDLKLDYRVSDLKETFYLRQAGRRELPDPASLGLNVDTTYLVFATRIAPDERLEAFAGNARIASAGKGRDRAQKFDFEGDERVDFRSLKGDLKYFFPEDSAFLLSDRDTSSVQVEAEGVFKRIYADDTGDVILTGVSYRWLADLAPGTVVIDPTVGIQPVSGNGTDNFLYKGGGGNDNYGGINTIQIGPDMGPGERRGLVAFNLDAIPASAQVTRATLQLYLTNQWGTANDFTIEAHRMTKAWVEGTGSTWNNNSTAGSDWTYADDSTDDLWHTAGMGTSDYDPQVLSETLVELADDEVWKSWDVTTAVQNWVNGTDNYGLALITKAADMSKHIGAIFRSSDYTGDPSLCPKLIIEMAVTPLASYDYAYNTATGDLTVTADLANGVTETSNYSARGFLLDRQYDDANPGEIFDFSNSYDDAGNVMQQVFQHGSGVTRTFSYEPDDLYRLLSFKVDGNVTRTYVYDDNGNLTSFAGRAFTYAGGTNRVTGDGISTFGYDAGGRVNDIAGKTITYDYRNLLSKYGLTNVGRYDLHNKYDAAGRRVRKFDDDGTRFYVHSGPQVLAEYTTNRHPDKEYIYAGGQRIAGLKAFDNQARPPVRIEVASAGFDDGNFARLLVDGTDYASNQVGYNLAVLDESSGQVLDNVVFDTHNSPANADAMADYINALPHGRIVLAAVMDAAAGSMSEHAYQALESLGSSQCRNVGYRDSHALVGRKGATTGSAIEKYVPRYSGPARTQLHVVDCRVQSAGFDDGYLGNFWVGGVKLGNGVLGYNLVVIDEMTGLVLHESNFNTNASSADADAMAAFISNLPAGRIVLVAATDDASFSMTESAYLALESLGSTECRNVGYRDLHAMMGAKGAAIGSVPESHVARYNGYAEVELSSPAAYLAEGMHFYYTDHLASTRVLDDFDATQNDVTIDYYPFGEDHTLGGTGEIPPLKFTGYEEETGVGLYFARARFYHPGLGRLLSPDRAGQFWSPYAYVGNRPVDYVDPSGEFGFLVGPLGVAFFGDRAANAFGESL